MLDHEFPEDDFDYGRDSHHYRPIKEEPEKSIMIHNETKNTYYQKKKKNYYY